MATNDVQREFTAQAFSGFSRILLGSCMDFARNSHRFCKEITFKSLPGHAKSISAGPKSTPDRLEDS